MSDLSGRSALVTGGGVGIGRATVVSLARAGARVATAFYRHPPDDELKGELAATGVPLVARAVDMTDAEAVAEVVHDIGEAFGGIDILVNNAGGLVARQEVLSMTNEHWQQVIALNLSSAFLATRGVLPYMTRGWGRIINVSSLAAHNGGGQGAIAYAAAKAGSLGLTRGLAKELAPKGITVNAVAPGFIRGTPFHETFTAPADQKAVISQIPIGHGGSPDDVAAAILWLASEAAGFVTGAVLDVNGGQLLH